MVSTLKVQSMILISNMGNTHGRTPEENSPEYLLSTFSEDYIVKTDLWVFPKRFYTGVDQPIYRIRPEILKSCLIEARNINAFEFIVSSGLHGFYRGDSDLVYTSKGWLLSWGPLLKQAIIMNPERHSYHAIFNCAGICSDYIESFTDENSGNA